MSSSETPLSQSCKSCGQSFTGNYCNHCGEKVLLPEDRSFKTFINSILIASTLANSKFLRTLGYVVRKPGFISNEFAEGKRVRYMAPISLFFVLNLVYFLFPLIQLFSASLNTQLLAPYGSFLEVSITNKIVNEGLNLESFSVLYNQKTVGLAKLLVMVFVVLSSIPLHFLYRKKNRFFTDHVGYSVELACYNLFVNALLLTLIVKIFGLGHYLNELSLTLIFVLTNLYFLLRSGIVFYREKGWRLILKSMLMLIFLKVALEGYRFILFFITLLLM